LKRGIHAQTVPLREVRRLQLPEREGDSWDGLNQNRHENVALKAFVCLSADPLALDRAVGPYYDDTSSSIDLLLDDFGEFATSRNHVIPPDGPSFRLERVSQTLGVHPVLASVANENVAHVCAAA
jgi:hypothetical protein